MYISTQDLKARGWTNTLIKKFFEKPDQIKELGRYACQYFYDHVRVSSVEQTNEFQLLKENAAKRRASGLASADKRKNDYLNYLRLEMAVRVRRVDLDVLLLDAIDSYNAHRAARWERRNFDADCYTEPATRNSDQSFLERITVNYIRHNLTRYDAMLKSQKGKMAKEEAIKIVQQRVYQAIIDVYPEYHEECERQIIDKGLLQKFDADENGQLNLF